MSDDTRERFGSTAGLRLMIYSQDGLGLGHMRRTGSIAAEFLRKCPDALALTVHDSPLGRFFELPGNQDYVKLPSIVKLGPGHWQAVNLPLEFDEVQAMRSDLLRATALRFRPDLLLVDHMPHGATGELIPALEGLRRARQPTKVVLGLRDILDAPEVIRRQWLAEGALDAVERYYDRILVYGIRDLFDLAEAYGLPPAVSARVRYCGYVCTSAKARYTARIRAEYTAGSKQAQKLLVAMAGGGADAYPAMRALVDAVPHLQRKLQFRLVLITGPFMPPEHRRDLQARAAGLPVKVRISVSDSLSYIDAADLVVAMAGYNTTTEILRSGTPAVLIPRAGPSAEQRMRVRLFLARGWVHAIDPDAATGPRVARTILKALRPQPPKDGQPGPDLRGLTAVVDELLALHSEGSSGRRSVAGARV